MDSRHDWVLVLRPSEVVSEELAKSIRDWSARSKKDDEAGYALQVKLREKDETFSERPEMRLVNKRKINWTGHLPPNNTVAPQLPGEIIRYREWEPEQAA